MSRPRSRKVSQNLGLQVQRYLHEEHLEDFRVSNSDLVSKDFKGWLLDQADSKQKWCVISDIVFCIFENETSGHAEEVIILPGCEITEIKVDDNEITNDYYSQESIIITRCADDYRKIFRADSVFSHRKWMRYLSLSVDLDAEEYSNVGDFPPENQLERGSSSDDDIFLQDTRKNIPQSETQASHLQRKEAIRNRKDFVETKLKQNTRTEKDDIEYRSPNSGRKKLYPISRDTVSKLRSFYESNDERVPAESKLGRIDEYVMDKGDAGSERRLPRTSADAHCFDVEKKHLSTLNSSEKGSVNSMNNESVKPSRKTSYLLATDKSLKPENSDSQVQLERKHVILRSIRNATLSTYLRHVKDGNVIKVWAIVHDDHLYIFKTKIQSEMSFLNFDLKEDEVAVVDPMSLQFKVTVEKEHLFAAQDRYDFKRWMTTLLPGSDVTIPSPMETKRLSSVIKSSSNGCSQNSEHTMNDTHSTTFHESPNVDAESHSQTRNSVMKQTNNDLSSSLDTGTFRQLKSPREVRRNSDSVIESDGSPDVVNARVNSTWYRYHLTIGDHSVDLSPVNHGERISLPRQGWGKETTIFKGERIPVIRLVAKGSEIIICHDDVRQTDDIIGVLELHHHESLDRKKSTEEMKQELLEEVNKIRTSVEEGKRAREKMRNQRKVSPYSQPSESSALDDSSNISEEMRVVKEITQLKQRKISTIIKMETLQKQIDQSTIPAAKQQSSKNPFKFMSKDPPQQPQIRTATVDQLTGHLKDLTGRLESIDEHLSKQQDEQKRLEEERLDFGNKSLDSNTSSEISNRSVFHSPKYSDFGKRSLDSGFSECSKEATDFHDREEEQVELRRAKTTPRSRSRSPKARSKSMREERVKEGREKFRRRPKSCYLVSQKAMDQISAFEQLIDERMS